jgi:squalene synthase HpnC
LDVICFPALLVASPNARSFASPPSSETAPAVRAAFRSAADRAEAEAITRELAHNRYENFSVVSLLLPQRLRQDFCNIYAFCRLADDLGDELGDPAESLKQLDRFRDDLRACYAGRSTSAVFLALAGTIERYEIPIDPFLDLISAFEQDQRIKRYETFEDVIDYCRRSANPVGRLVLYVCGYRDAERQRLSDFTCTALQLANFWQDVRRDLSELDRVYIPRTSLARFGVSEQQLADGRADDAYRALIRFEVDRADAMFEEGERLLPLLDPPVRRHVALFGLGGRAVLDAIRRQDYDTLTRRPRLSSLQKGRLVARAVTSHLLAGFGRARGAAL